jgi:hypothetical protein
VRSSLLKRKQSNMTLQNSYAERRATRAVTTTEAPYRGRGALYVFDPGDYDHGSLTAAGERIYEAAFNEASTEYNNAHTRLLALYNAAPGDHADKVDAVFGAVHDWLDDDIREDLADEFEKMGVGT